MAWASRTSKAWLGQSCPSPDARTRLSVLRLHGLESLCHRCTDKTVRATQGRRRDADATQQDFVTQAGSPCHAGRRRDADATQKDFVNSL
ncbi:MAG: hypothetical protein NZ556_09090 [Fimbriimonadales bacterium]|nr:hypothetical protein [Fimbriimonadales bacterium]